MKALSCHNTACFDKIYTEHRHIDDPAQGSNKPKSDWFFDQETIKGGPCTCKNGTLGLQGGLYLT